MDDATEPSVGATVDLAGSVLPPPSGARRVGAADGSAIRSVSVYLNAGSGAPQPFVDHAERAGLTVEPGPGDSLKLSGPTSAFEGLFGVTISRYEDPDGAIFDVPDAPLRLPPSVAAMVAGVFGVDTRPAARRRD
jgi:hypothetical protein